MKIYDIAAIKMGYAFRSRIENDPDGHFKVIQPKDISNEGTLLTEEIVTTGMDSVNSSHLLQKGDVLLVSRGRFTSAVYDDQFPNKCIASGSLLILTVQNAKPVLPDYLVLFFNSDRGNYQLHRLTERTTIPFLNRSSLEQMDIPVPNLETQEKLIALERAKQRYAQLTSRKVALLNSLINHELTTIN